MRLFTGWLIFILVCFAFPPFFWAMLGLLAIYVIWGD